MTHFFYCCLFIFTLVIRATCFTLRVYKKTKVTIVLEGRKIDVGVSSLAGCNALFDHDVVTAFKDIKTGHEILLWYGNNRQERPSLLRSYAA